MGRIRSFPLVVWLLLFGLWVLFSGKYTPFHLSIGLLVVVLIAWLSSRLPASEDPGPPLKTYRLLLYGPWLLWQMLLSSYYVSKVILFPSRHVDPQLFVFRSAQKGELAKFILANSITITPGTLTVHMEEDRFLIHSLTRKTKDDLMNGEMQRRVAHIQTDEDIGQPEALKIKEIRERT